MNKNIDSLYHELLYGKHGDGSLEYCYERFFGYQASFMLVDVYQ